MKVYILAHISGIYMFPYDKKIYKSLAGATKALDKIKKEDRCAKYIVILEASNWTEVRERAYREDEVREGVTMKAENIKKDIVETFQVRYKRRVNGF